MHYVYKGESKKLDSTFENMFGGIYNQFFTSFFLIILTKDCARKNPETCFFM